MSENADTVERPKAAQLPSRSVYIAAAVVAAVMGAWAGNVYAWVSDYEGADAVRPGLLCWGGVLLGGASGCLVALGWRRAMAASRIMNKALRATFWGAAWGIVAGCASTLILHLGLSIACVAVDGGLPRGAVPVGLIWSFAGVVGCGAGAVVGAIAGFLFGDSLRQERAS